MYEVGALFQNRVLGVSILSWFIAQILKVLVVFITERRLKFSRMVGSGGMPSSHSAFSASLAMGIGFHEGFQSPMFALAAVFAMVVMYDATGVRQAAGKQAKVLNRILEDMLDRGQWINQEQLKELIGHTPIEVIVGALLGVLIAVIAA
jgi:acid phosphatase family membrane protein YuiD